MLDILGKLEGSIFARVYKVAEAHQLFAFSTQEKAVLIPPTQKVLDKYSPAWIQKYGDEAELALLFVKLTGQKVAFCRQLAAKRRKEEAEAKRQASGKPQEVSEAEWRDPVDGEPGVPEQTQ